MGSHDHIDHDRDDRGGDAAKGKPLEETLPHQPFLLTWREIGFRKFTCDSVFLQDAEEIPLNVPALEAGGEG